MATLDPNIQSQLMYLFERVGEPLYFGPRGILNTYYNVSTDNLPPKQKHAADEFLKKRPTDRNSSNIDVKPPTRMPNLDGIGAICPKNGIFCHFLPAHRRAATELRKILMAEESMENFLSMSCACRDSDKVNPRLWIYSFASCALQRQDLKGFRLPAYWEIMPDEFVSPVVTRQAQRQAILPEQDRAVIIVDPNFTGDNSNPEGRLGYWREDLGMNSHHWHWHLIYPIEAPAGQRDRKGELFYYMHHSMIARYDAERLSHNMGRVRRLKINEEIAEGYFPKLYDTNSGVNWGSRQDGTRLESVDRSSDPRVPFTLELNDLKKWEARIYEAIDTGVIIGANGTMTPLTIERGIDILGDIVEAAEAISPNLQFYGDYHNMGHLAIGASHDPKYKHRENLGVMGDLATVMRDPVFYRWHKHIDEIFDKYKATIAPYSNEELIFPGIQVTELNVQTPHREPNILTTHWMQSDVDLSRGMDFGRTDLNNLGPIWARVTHLNHEDFSYKINVTSSGNQPVDGTVRIFMAPRNNERGGRFDMTQQRLLFFELDKFTTNLRPGANVIERASKDSSVTIPWEQSFRDLERSVETPLASDFPTSTCGCGWPQHLLLPRGQPTGMLFDLYVLVSDGAKDLVQRKTKPSNEGRSCRDAVSYCGLLDDLYPDARAMGYPFDRHLPLVNNQPLANLDAFVQNVPNSRSIQIRIVHRDVTLVRPGGAPEGMDTLIPTQSSRPSTPESPTGIPGTFQPPERPSSPTEANGKCGPIHRPSSPNYGWRV